MTAPGVHPFDDGEHWRSLTVDQLLAAVAEQIEPQADGQRVDDDYARSVIADGFRTVVEDVMDRAQDMSGCGKPDECRAVAVFLAWLSWNLDHELLPEELR